MFTITKAHGTRDFEVTPRVDTAAVATEAPEHGWKAAALAILRVATGFIFLWAFVDKLFGLGYSTPSEKSWIHGGSPTQGFLSHVEVGPFQGFFHSIAGAAWADWGFMLGLAGIGIALIAGVAMRLTAVGTTVLMLMMWAAEWPLAQTTSGGQPSGSVNPLVDYHIIYAIVVIALAAFGAGRSYGLAKLWNKVVRDNRYLR
jgi:thiosulfate dehydrogenase (quinone) large subunit